MTDNIIKSIKAYLKSISNLKAFVYDDSSINISDTFSVHSKSEIAIGGTTFTLVDNDDDSDLTGFDTDYFVGWFLKYDGGSEDVYRQITAYDNTTGVVTIEESFSDTVAIPITELLELAILDAVFLNSGTEFQSYMKMNATEEKLTIYLHLQTKDDSDRARISDNAYSVKKDLIKKKKRLPIYAITKVDGEDVIGDICGYMKVLSSIGLRAVQNDDVQIQKSLMSFTVSYTMNYMK